MTPARALEIVRNLRPGVDVAFAAETLAAFDPSLEDEDAEALARDALSTVAAEDEDAFADDCDARQQAMHDDFNDYATEHDSEADHGYAPEYMNRPGRWD